MKFFSRKIYLLLLPLIVGALAQSEEHQHPNKWLNVEIGIIGPASVDILDSAFRIGQKENYQGIIISLDTPGGALDATRRMVKTIMASDIPVAVWVGPSGAHAGSAGSFITIAAHIASMAKGTNIGAAHPVKADGKKMDNPEISRKILNDTLAFIESIAQKRGRNVEMARSFVALSTSITAEEALENNIIDLIAESPNELLEKMNGTEVSLSSGSTTKITSENALILNYKKGLREKLLEILSNPNFFYLLFLAGMMGLGFEITHPGSIFPGVIGGICLILALIATSTLPVSFGAAALIILGVALMIAESFVPSFGVLGVGGFIGFVLGSVFLVDPSNEHGLRISWTYIAPGAVMVAAFGTLVGWLVIKAENAPQYAGVESFKGKKGKALEDFTGSGKIEFDGEIWQAECRDNAAVFTKGEEIEIEKVSGLVATIKKQNV